MKALLIDDERLARQELRSMLEVHSDIEIIGEAKDGHDALKKIADLQPDLLFLDIQMPGMTGFELLEQLDSSPQVIFVTAYDEHAIRAFEYSALDYLLKPVDGKRLNKAIQRAKEEFNAAEAISAEKVFLKDGDNCWFVSLDKVSFFTSVGNYTQVHFETHKPLIRRSLNQLEQRLPEDSFFRTSRQHIINLAHVAAVDTAINGNMEVTMLTGDSLELSRRQSQLFRETLSL